MHDAQNHVENKVQRAKDTNPRPIPTVLRTYSSFLKQLIGEAVVFILKMSEGTPTPFGVRRLNVQKTWKETMSWCKMLEKINLNV